MGVVGDEKDCIVVYPERVTIVPLWPVASTQAYETVFTVVKMFQKVYEINRTSTHFMGFSQGGWMTWWMWAMHREDFGKFVAIAAGLNALPGPNMPWPAEILSGTALERVNQRPIDNRTTLWFIYSSEDKVVQNIGQTKDAFAT